MRTVPRVGSGFLGALGMASLPTSELFVLDDPGPDSRRIECVGRNAERRTSRSRFRVAAAAVLVARIGRRHSHRCRRKPRHGCVSCPNGTVALIGRGTWKVGCARPFRSDHFGEFVEPGSYPEMGSSGFDSGFVVATAKVLYERVTADHH